MERVVESTVVRDLVMNIVGHGRGSLGFYSEYVATIHLFIRYLLSICYMSDTFSCVI